MQIYLQWLLLAIIILKQNALSPKIAKIRDAKHLTAPRGAPRRRPRRAVLRSPQALPLKFREIANSEQVFEHNGAHIYVYGFLQDSMSAGFTFFI